MDKRSALLEIDATLRDRGFTPLRTGLADYEGSIDVHGRAVPVRVSIPDVRFATRPVITLLDREAVPVEALAHIGDDDAICYSSAAGIPVDLYAPGQAILRFLIEAAETLQRSFRGRAVAEIAEEYQDYWWPKTTVRIMLPRDGKPMQDAKTTRLYVGSEQHLRVMTEAPSIAGYEMRLDKKGRLFRLGGRLAPAVGIRKPANLDQLKLWYAAQATTGLTWDQFYRALFDCDHVFLAAENAILGFELDLPADLATGVRRGSIRKDKLRGIAGLQSSRIGLSRLGGKWAGIDRVVRRNMGTAKNLEGLSVAVIGCGTIGSHLAKFLAQSGAGCGARLHLFDKDVLSEGNLGRHLLGFGDIGKLKASAVAAELMRFHPQIDVVAHDVDALAEWRMLSRADLLIDATGDWNVQNALNEAFLSAPDKRPKALLHSWVFMNGAGVQNFLNLGDKFACFRCLKPELNGAWRFPVGVEQDELDLQPATCGDGVYIPFSVDVPVIAAALTSRAAVDWAGGKPGQRLRSQVTDPAKGRHQKWQSPEPSPHCPACRNRRQ